MSNFQCDKCGMTNIDCGWGKFKTPREIELEEKLTAEENKNFELKEEIKELRDLNRRLDNQREEYWKEYLKLDKKIKIAEEALQYYADGEDMDEARVLGSCAWKYIVDDNYADTAKQALKQMEEIKNLEADTDVYGCFMEILNIIDKAKRGLTTR